MAFFFSNDYPSYQRLGYIKIMTQPTTSVLTTSHAVRSLDTFLSPLFHRKRFSCRSGGRYFYGTGVERMP